MTNWYTGKLAPIYSHRRYIFVSAKRELARESELAEIESKCGRELTLDGARIRMTARWLG